MITHTAWAHGTRDEILAELRAAMTPGRSEKRKATLRDAIADLEAGASMVYIKPIRYVVRGEAAKVADEIITLMDDAQV
ncbi:hypothetical protein [Lentzea sp. CC55]|uniref:hypothetical protein n=1 Tax=Lentzea sp. CC55 TaxID=2884909 RepID=UPI001F340742|nr:hypothetical protein [Lentzea sp. CC55]MCG8926685.1 hypothetical protein [Lentzea sp. CC55]